MGVIRTGSIPHKSSEALKAKLKLEEEAPKVDLTSKPDIKSPPKPEPPKKVKLFHFQSYYFIRMFP